MSEKATHGSARDVLDFIDTFWMLLGWVRGVPAAARRVGAWTTAVPVRGGFDE